MRPDFLFELSAWAIVPSVFVFGALLGKWCAGFASRYSRLLLAISKPTACETAMDLPDDHCLLMGANGLWRSAWPSKAERNGAPVSIQCCAAALMALCVLAFERRYGISLAFAGLVAASALLLALALVDVSTLLLPDALTFPLLWLGLACAWIRGPLFLHESVAGAMAGYGFLWLLFWIYKSIRKRQGMGYGDFKLLAALGAWVGLARLPHVLLAACAFGVLFACLHQKKLSLSASYPFGPFLAISGMGVLLTEPEVHFYFWR